MKSRNVSAVPTGLKILLLPFPRAKARGYIHSPLTGLTAASSAANSSWRLCALALTLFFFRIFEFLCVSVSLWLISLFLVAAFRAELVEVCVIADILRQSLPRRRPGLRMPRSRFSFIISTFYGAIIHRMNKLSTIN